MTSLSVGLAFASLGVILLTGGSVVYSNPTRSRVEQYFGLFIAFVGVLDICFAVLLMSAGWWA